MKRWRLMVCVLTIIAFVLPASWFVADVQAQARHDIHIYGVRWKTDWVNQLLDTWEKQHPGITVTFHGEADYYNMIKVLLSTQPQRADIVLISPGYLAPWVKAGWLAPVDDLPGIADWKKKLPSEQVQAFSYGGKFYAPGVWYMLNRLMVYNERILKQAGFSYPPRTWDELIKQAIAIKQKGRPAYPVALHLKPVSRRIDWIWYSLSLSLADPSKPLLWDAKGAPMFLDEKSPGYRGLQLMKDLMQTHRVLSPGAFEMDTFDVVNAMMKGDAAFTITGDFQLAGMVDPARNPEAGNVKVMRMPGSGYIWYKTDGYGITQAATRKGEAFKQAVWEVLKYFGGPEFGKLNMLDWFGISPFKEVSADPEVRQVYGQYVPNVSAYFTQVERRKSLEFYADPLHNTSYYWQYIDEYVVPNLQQAVAGRLAVGDALKNIAAGAAKLKKEYGD
jgi:multiple sugar transport system substrate-binding protein